MLAKIKNKAQIPEVKAALIIVGCLFSSLLFIFMIVNFPKFTSLVSIIVIIAFLFYKLWKTIVEDIKKGEQRKTNRQ